MGIEGFIKNMDPKLKSLFENIMTVIMIVMMVYGAITYIYTYIEYNHFMAWFNTSHFITTVIILVFVGMGYKMLKGGTLHFEQGKGKKTEINIPDTYGVKKTKDGNQQTKLNMPNPFGAKNQQQQRMDIPNPMGQKPQQQNTLQQKQRKRTTLKGSWDCPDCGSVVVGSACLKCGYRRQ